MRSQFSHHVRIVSVSLLLLAAGFVGCSKTRVAEYKETLSLRLEHTPVKKHTGEEKAKIRATIISSFDLDGGGTRLVYREEGGDFVSVPMTSTVLDNEYVAELPSKSKGTRIEYYLQVRSLTGATITLPEDAIQTGACFTLTYQGYVPRVLSVLHFGSILVGMFLILLAGYWAYFYRKTGNRLPAIAKVVLAGTILLFAGGIPLHILVKFQSSGSVWEGIPIGTDRTDTVTLFLVLLWIVISLLFKGTLFYGEKEKNIVSDRTFANLVLGGTVVTIIVFLLPG